MFSPALQPYRYCWPTEDLLSLPAWSDGGDDGIVERSMPESVEVLAKDSRWPAFFPSPMCVVTTRDGAATGLEKVVGASIVNRFPYIIALSFCRKALSERHHERNRFMDMLESGGQVAVQFLSPGAELDRVMDSILTVPDSETGARIDRTGLPTRMAESNDAPVFADAYMVYEGRLVKPGKDFDGKPIFERPWRDVGSHRVYYLEINAIQLRKDIAVGASQIHWRALPAWCPTEGREEEGFDLSKVGERIETPYKKGYTPEYAFPSAGTTAFESDDEQNGMAIKHLAPLPEDQVEVDNDRARWPCFFPSACGMITSWTKEGAPNLMPCGSTTILSRHPLVIAPCVSYARINIRYAVRASLEDIQRSGRFGCAVPYIDERIVDALKYSGNVSIADDIDKIAHAGLTVDAHTWSPRLPAFPVHFDCEVTDQQRLGTHMVFFGEVKGISVRSDVTPDNPLEWCPWSDVRSIG